jgi:hypothetical protein
LTGILEGAGLEPSEVTSREDPRLREVDHGYSDVPSQHEMVAIHGHFYYRYHGGESPADCYDRVSGFLESFVRSIQKSKSRKALLVTHGLALRVFVMRMFHMTVEQFDAIANPHNCDIITVAPKGMLKAPQFTSVRWGVEGLRRYSPPAKAEEVTHKASAAVAIARGGRSPPSGLTRSDPCAAVCDLGARTSIRASAADDPQDGARSLPADEEPAGQPSTKAMGFF